MAEKRSEMYGQGAVLGSLAYDLLQSDFYEDEYAPERPAPRVVQPSAKKAEPVRRARSLAVPGAVLGAGLAGVLLVSALYGRIQLTTLNDQAVAAAKEIEVMQTEQTQLLIRYEETFDLRGIEAYATEELGMRRPRNDQISYVSAASPDKATVLDTEAEKTPLDKVFAFVDTIAACFQ